LHWRPDPAGTNFLFAAVLSVDGTTNACPSLHASLATYCVLCCDRLLRKKKASPATEDGRDGSANCQFALLPAKAAGRKQRKLTVCVAFSLRPWPGATQTDSLRYRHGHLQLPAKLFSSAAVCRSTGHSKWPARRAAKGRRWSSRQPTAPPQKESSSRPDRAASAGFHSARKGRRGAKSLQSARTPVPFAATGQGLSRAATGSAAAGKATGRARPLARRRESAD